LAQAGTMIETVRGAGYRLTAKPAVPVHADKTSA
jgi:two-component system, OmpR family, phosphate regulon response regulator PhoB